MNNSCTIPKEIIVVTVEIGEGGAERVLTELMEEWARNGHHITLIQTKPGFYGHSYSIPKGIQNIDISSNKKSKVGRYYDETISLLKIMRSRPKASVVAFANASIRIVGVCSLFTSNRIVFSERCDPRFTPYSKLLRLLRDWLFVCADVCVFQTEEAKKLFPLRVQKKGVIIPNPVNPHLPPIFHGQRKKVIITACRLAPQKNLPMLINAFAMLHREYPDYSLEIYGSGSEREKLQEHIDNLGINSCAKLMGHSMNIHDIMRESYMYVCSSDYEGLSNSILEALALGLPVISTDHPIGGAKEMITNHVNGLLVPVGDDNSLYIAMKYIIENPQKAQLMGKKAADIRYRWPVQVIANYWINYL